VEVTVTAYAVTDTTKPVITLTGNATENVANGATYTDAGVTITDNKDTGLESVVTYTKGEITVDSIDTSVAGTYTIHYNVSDVEGNAAVEVTRTVIVAAPADTTAPVVENATLLVDNGLTLNFSINEALFITQ